MYVFCKEDGNCTTDSQYEFTLTNINDVVGTIFSESNIICDYYRELPIVDNNFCYSSIEYIWTQIRRNRRFLLM